MSKDHFVLTAVQALPNCCLRLRYEDGQTLEVDLSERVRSKAKLGFGGRSVDWIEDELDLGSDNLRHLATEQAGGIGHERIWTWLHDTGMTLEQAAQALGISRRMLIYYRDGEKAIPRAIWLACLGWLAVRPQGKHLPLHPPSAREYAALHPA